MVSRRWAASLGGYLMMDLSYACIPNSGGNLIRICREPFIDGYLESYEDRLKNTYGKGILGVKRINMARKDDHYTLVFFMGVDCSDSEDEDDVRVKQELIHQELIGDIYSNNSKHFSDTPNHLSIEAPESTRIVRLPMQGLICQILW